MTLSKGSAEYSILYYYNTTPTTSFTLIGVKGVFGALTITTMKLSTDFNFE